MLPQNYQFVHKAPVIPVMVINDIKHAVPMAQALIAAGADLNETAVAHGDPFDVPLGELSAGSGTLSAHAAFVHRSSRVEQLKTQKKHKKQKL